MVDLSKARAGDTVKFRCGGTAVIDNVTHPILDEKKTDRVYLAFKDFSWGDEFMLDGHKYDFTNKHPMDITEVIPAPVAFDWNKVKVGMAFKVKGIRGKNGLVAYIGKAIFNKDCVMVQALYDASVKDAGFVLRKEDLTRAPEHDVEAG